MSTGKHFANNILLSGTFAGDLAAAIRANTSLHFGLYFSLFEWFNPLYLQDKANGYKTKTYVEVR